MNTVLWILQVILCIKLISVSHTHGFGRSRPAMQEAMRQLGKASLPLHTIIAILTFAGAAGLILPGILGWSPWMISVTAMLIGVLLLASAVLHIRSRKEPKIFVSAVLFLFAALIAYGRSVTFR